MKVTARILGLLALAGCTAVSAFASEPAKLNPMVLDGYARGLASGTESQRNDALKRLADRPADGAAVLDGLGERLEALQQAYGQGGELKKRAQFVEQLRKLHEPLAAVRTKIGTRTPVKGDADFAELLARHEPYFQAVQIFLSQTGPDEQRIAQYRHAIDVLAAALKRQPANAAQLSATPKSLLLAQLAPEAKAFFDGEETYWRRVRQVWLWNTKHTEFAQGYDRTAIHVFNQYRLLHGELPLELDAKLLAAATAHTEEMVKLNYFGHGSPVAENEDWATRIKNAGYEGSPYRENCAAGMFRPGDQAARASFAMWTYSPGHHLPIRSVESIQAGVGFAGNKATACFGTTKSPHSKDLDPGEQPFAEIRIDYNFLKQVFSGGK